MRELHRLGNKACPVFEINKSARVAGIQHFGRAIIIPTALLRHHVLSRAGGRVLGGCCSFGLLLRFWEYIKNNEKYSVGNGRNRDNVCCSNS